ncbi:hypothetical protein VUR80DRAFT_1484 [Thermomyces stellatus]
MAGLSYQGRGLALHGQGDDASGQGAHFGRLHDPARNDKVNTDEYCRENGGESGWRATLVNLPLSRSPARPATLVCAPTGRLSSLSRATEVCASVLPSGLGPCTIQGTSCGRHGIVSRDSSAQRGLGQAPRPWFATWLGLAKQGTQRQEFALSHGFAIGLCWDV